MRSLIALILITLPQAAFCQGDPHVTDSHLTEDYVEPMLTWWATAETMVDPEILPYADTAGKVARLSSAETVPFRLLPYDQLGKAEPVTRENFDPKEYAEGIHRFADVYSCLEKTEREKPQPDLTKFDWRLIDTDGAAYACYGWIVTSYETVSDFKNWLECVGFRVVRFEHFTDASGRPGTVVQAAIRRPYRPTGSLNAWLRSFVESQTYNLIARFQRGTGLTDLVILAHRMK